MPFNWSYHLVWCLCLGLQSYGQTNTPAPVSESFLCPALQAFNGEWRYTKGSDTIRIYFRYHEAYSRNPTNDLFGNLWIWHEYKKGDTIVESTYANRFMPLPNNNDSSYLSKYSGFLLLPRCDFSTCRLVGIITDISQARERKVVRAYFDTAITKITWKQRHADGYGFMTGAKGMTLPKEFVLIKQ